MTKPPMRLIALCLMMLRSLSHGAEEGWIPLFNGRNLDGWTPKFAGHPLGENAFNTFRVENGILKVSYDGYPEFGGRFGHLFTNLSYSHYLFRLQYRFEGARMADAPGYVNLNSGVMIHAQPPQSMEFRQGFPVSMEFQFLADEGRGPRPTGNVCTPGTHLEMDGTLITRHIVESSAPTFPAGEWVSIEVEVRGGDEVIHRVNGREVLRYTKPRLDPECPIVPAAPLVKAGAPLRLSHGHIALQAEGQGVWFRDIEIKPLDPPPLAQPAGGVVKPSGVSPTK